MGTGEIGLAYTFAVTKWFHISANGVAVVMKSINLPDEDIGVLKMDSFINVNPLFGLRFIFGNLP